jgi:cellulose synthase/poly-beta-1,6-N-acetylglucosamine synthase-like glycosyltransferase
MVELVLYLSVFGALCWWSILLLPWRPWSTREKIESGIAKGSHGEMLNDITVLIPARNEGPYIRHTLDGVNAQGIGVQIIVIDDQSIDDTAKQAKRMWCTGNIGYCTSYGLERKTMGA